MNFFQVPNFLWDREDLDIYERAILTHIIRKTIGWGKSEDGISLNQFQKVLGISKSTVIRTLKKLIDKRIISKKTNYLDDGSQSFNSYSLTDEVIKMANSSISETQGEYLSDTGGSISQTQGGVSEIDTQNTLNTKYTNTKEKKEKKEKKILNFIFDFLEELSKTTREVNKRRMEYEVVISNLIAIEGYEEKEVEDALYFALRDDFWCDKLFSPNSLKRNFEKILFNSKKAKKEEEGYILC